jgi:hypothetical protein
MANFTLTVGADTLAGGAADDTVTGRRPREGATLCRNGAIIQPNPGAESAISGI